MVGTQRIFDPSPRMRLPLRPQHMAHQDRRALSGGSLAGAGCHCRHRPAHHYPLAYVQALAGYGTMVGTERSGL